MNVFHFVINLVANAAEFRCLTRELGYQSAHIIFKFQEDLTVVLMTRLLNFRVVKHLNSHTFKTLRNLMTYSWANDKPSLEPVISQFPDGFDYRSVRTVHVTSAEADCVIKSVIRHVTGQWLASSTHPYADSIKVCLCRISHNSNLNDNSTYKLIYIYIYVCCTLYMYLVWVWCDDIIALGGCVWPVNPVFSWSLHWHWPYVSEVILTNQLIDQITANPIIMLAVCIIIGMYSTWRGGLQLPYWHSIPHLRGGQTCK